MVSKKSAQIRAKKAPNTTLQIYAKKKEMQKFKPKNHLKLP